MKKLALAVLMIAGTCCVLTSCDNGDYDADPTKNTGALNPLDTSTGVQVYLGTMKATLNNTRTTFYPAYYTKTGDNEFKIVGVRANDPVLKHTINIGITNFKNLSEFNASFTYTFVDTAREDSLSTYFGDVKVGLTGNESENYRGTFSGTVNLKHPVENKSDVIKITDGYFYVPKQ